MFWNNHTSTPFGVNLVPGIDQFREKRKLNESEALVSFAASKIQSVWRISLKI
jgi:hypothetical protein